MEKSLDIWGQSLNRGELEEERKPSRDVLPYDPSSEDTVFSQETGVCSLEISCNTIRTPGPTRRLATLCSSDKIFEHNRGSFLCS